MQNTNSLGSPSEPLPLDTTAAIQLLDLFRDPDHDVDRIVELISEDPVLSAETLKRCNNAVFGSGERITDIFEAVNRLGYYELYGIIAATLGVQIGQTGQPANDALARPAGRGGSVRRATDFE